MALLDKNERGTASKYIKKLTNASDIREGA